MRGSLNIPSLGAVRTFRTFLGFEHLLNPAFRYTTVVDLVIAEKPSVARDLARVLGVRPSGKTHFEGKDWVITWCIGHLVELEEPAHYDPRWKSWRMDTLPMIPGTFSLRPVPTTRDQLNVVCNLLRNPDFSRVVNACDAGREGELIFRYVYQLAQSRQPIARLWVSSLTDEAIRKGFATLKPGKDYEALADAARCRSEADWLVGLNATRAVTLRHRTGRDSPLFSIGRVQTPTLAILVEREKTIAAFVPQDYHLVKAQLTTGAGVTFPASYTLGKATRFASSGLANAVRDRSTEHGAFEDRLGPVVERLTQSTSREAPPFLFDLTSLQRTANKRFGLSAQVTLEAAQGLYERHKVLTYPRTDSRHLSTDMLGELPRIITGMADIPDYAGFARYVLSEKPHPGKRVFDDSKVSDHHAIIPTGKVIPLSSLGRDEARVYDLVVRRFLGAFFPDAEFAHTEVVVRVGGTGAIPSDPPDSSALITALPPPPDRFVAKGKVRLIAGWQEVLGFGDEESGKNGKKGKKKDDEEDEAQILLPVLVEGERFGGSFSTLAKKTKPPSRHTEASLLSAMENAGKMVEDETLRAAMKDSGLGTPATRASIIETIIKRSFVHREGKALVPTPMGIGLIDALPIRSLASPELTGSWEARLARIARGKERRAAFMEDIGHYVLEMVQACRGSGPMPKIPTEPAKVKRAPAKRKRANKEEPSSPPMNSSMGDLLCPTCKQGKIMAGKRGWGCTRWRDGCSFVVWFEENGQKRSEADLRRIVAGG